MSQLTESAAGFQKPLLSQGSRSILLHVGIVILLFLLYFALPVYHSGNLARILVLAVFAMGYNVLFGYTGLLSLGHALFFASGMYGFGLAIQFIDVVPIVAIIIGLLSAVVVSVVVGILALRTTGVAFMIVTLMFAQAGYLTVLLFGEYTRGDEGFNIHRSDRVLFGFDLSQATNRYFCALILFAICFFLTAWLVHSRFGKTLVAIRENEERARMLGYDIQRHKLIAVIISGALSGAAGVAYALLFGYAGASFAAVQYSILPLLYVLLGGAGTTIGPLIGTVFMFYLIDLSSDLASAYLSSEFASAYMLIAGIVLILLTLFAPQGFAGLLRSKCKWLP